MSAPVNAARGEAGLVIDGRLRRLRLTLGALAELETAFEAASLEALEARLRRPSATDLLVIVSALLRGAGEDPDALPLGALDPAAVAGAVAEALRRAGGG
jgi:hypothetical protein